MKYFKGLEKSQKIGLIVGFIVGMFPYLLIAFFYLHFGIENMNARILTKFDSVGSFFKALSFFPIFFTSFGFGLGYLYSHFRKKKTKLSDDLILGGLIGGLVGIFASILIMILSHFVTGTSYGLIDFSNPTIKMFPIIIGIIFGLGVTYVVRK